MKSILLLLFTGWFTLLSTGVNINAHWCGSKVASVRLFGSKAESCKCSKKKAAKNKSCCSTSAAYFKIKDHFTASENCTPPLVFSTTLFFANKLICLYGAHTIPVESFISSKAPPSLFQSIYLLLQNFRL